MSQSTDIFKNPLKRDGISQKKRRLPALDPAFVKVDERTVEDFLVFAQAFAKQVHYYNIHNQQDGNWEDFFKCDTSTVIAAIEKTNPLTLKETFQNNKKDPATLPAIAVLADQTLLLARLIDTWLKAFSAETTFKALIRKYISANLGTLLPRLAGFEKEAAAKQSLFDDEYPAPQPTDYAGFSTEWNSAAFDAIAPDPSLFLLLDDDDPTSTEQLNAAQRKVEELFTKGYNILLQIIAAAPAHFEKSLQTQDHEPHLALFIAFLKLYMLVRDDLNQMTRWHTDFFYENVLLLEREDAVPDKVHLFFELAKNIPEHKLDKGIRFVAGKDASGKNLFYTLDQDNVLNRATVDSLRTVFLNFDQAGVSYPSVKKVVNVHAAPVANSGDGVGGEFADPALPTWATLGSTEIPQGKLGFAIASNELLLAEGQRTVTLKILTDAQPVGIGTAQFDIFLSGKKAWLETKDLTGINIAPLGGGENGFSITFTIGPDKPAIVPFDPAVLKEDLGTLLPVLKILLHEPLPTAAQAFAYEALKSLKIDKIHLTVQVVGASTLLAFNDQGPVDVTKPFMPFGSSPKEGSSFYVGGAEVFRKSLHSLTLKVAWENQPHFSTHYRAYDNPPSKAEDFTTKTFIQKSTAAGGQIELSPARGLFTPSMVFESTDLANAILETELETYGLAPTEGFLRLDLQRDFEHDQFQQVLTRQMLAASKLPKEVQGAYYLKAGDTIEQGNSNTDDAPGAVIIPKEPYTPSIKSLTLDYTSKSGTGDLLFLHVHPFSGTFQHFAQFENAPVLPQFPDEGALFIGLKDLLPRQSLSLLFQMAENTADADIPEAEVHWHFLADNAWVEFQGYEVAQDTTNGLISSGIVTFAIPPSITNTNTILPTGLHWLKASVPHYAGALSELIAVHAQAARSTLQDNANDPAHLKTPLPAETISKLEEPDTALKGIFQLYDSFGGRAAEEGLDFYTRVSERLRHKGRAITLFDYERLVLQAFPEIYKAKCINHTNEFDQLRPGHVLISVIPDFTKLKAVDRLQPKVTRAKLEAIQEFLEKRNCAFVSEQFNSLHVLNPVFEEITVDFKVRFHPDVTAIEFYLQELKKAIVRFLAPWAFDDGAEINFNGKMYKSSIINFVEEQTYVEFVTDFQMKRGGSSEDIAVVEGLTQRSIIVPVSEDSITISHIDELPYCPVENTIVGEGYEYGTVGEDLFISP